MSTGHPFAVPANSRAACIAVHDSPNSSKIFTIGSINGDWPPPPRPASCRWRANTGADDPRMRVRSRSKMAAAGMVLLPMVDVLVSVILVHSSRLGLMPRTLAL